jgi:hypothetical protein
VNVAAGGAILIDGLDQGVNLLWVRAVL